jgi:hypothetical protein
MTHCAHSAIHPEGAETGDFHPFRDGPPLPFKLLLVGAAFLVCPPLGLAALAFVLWRGRHGGCRGWGGGGGRRRSLRGTGNSVLDEKRRETLKALDEEAEAFAEFRKQEREKHDREAFDRFMAGRGEKQ